MNDRRTLSKLNIGLILMILLLVYILWLIFSYAGKNTISSYTVQLGSLAKSNIYEGIIIRSETVVSSPVSGYIDYFSREGEHVGVGDIVFAVDESGMVSDMINAQAGGDNSLSNEDLSELQDEVSNFCSNYDDSVFYKTYDFMYDMNGLVLKFANLNMLDEINKINAAGDAVDLYRCEQPGYVVYNIDGYESLSMNGISAEVFDKELYEKNQLVNDVLIDEGAPAYKLIDSDTWSVVIQIDEERALELTDAGYVDVKILDDQNVMSAKVQVFPVLEDYYAMLTFNSGVMRYCKDRYIDVEIMTQEEEGLKIPVSSIVTKTFYLIPEDYAVEEGNNNEIYFLRKTFLEDGTVSAELIALEVYSSQDGYFYVNDSALELGDYLIKPNSLEEYAVASQAELEGVYNMNLGYADFRRIIVLYSNEEYAIVKSNTKYGLREYDFIVLDSTTVKEDSFVYE